VTPLLQKGRESIDIQHHNFLLLLEGSDRQEIALLAILGRSQLAGEIPACQGEVVIAIHSF
jgi:hypothetical protein